MHLICIINEWNSLPNDIACMNSLISHQNKQGFEGKKLRGTDFTAFQQNLCQTMAYTANLKQRFLLFYYLYFRVYFACYPPESSKIICLTCIWSKFATTAEAWVISNGLSQYVIVVSDAPYIQARFPLYRIFFRGAMKSYSAWYKQQRPWAAQVVHTQ